ncbi:hypothetical protein AA313_de0209793 [Arthrobotrys entomopaga]|nr:hypothetical protein AA313_de0209793 [Arthrobotrys entomopaga]
MLSRWTLVVSSVGLVALPATVVAAGSLKDINHVVLFMQENRAFDHYFGTMAGVRGFYDPNVQVNSNGRSVFYQDVINTKSTPADYLLPWHINYLGGVWSQGGTQCMAAGSNGWTENHAALNGGQNNRWVLNNTAYSWGHFQREDIPVQFALAEGWTVGDMYQESVIASTDPNRIYWASGSINVPGSPQTPDQGGMMIDNRETPGCEGANLNCWPMKWKTVAEYWQDAGVTWQVYQNTDNFDDNPLHWFEQFQNAPTDSDLANRGVSFKYNLDKFYADAAAGTLPQVSYIIGPAQLSEHAPYLPSDGGWLQQQVTNAVINGKSYNDTVLIISYDETGGWGDHVTPYHSPEGTPGEWVKDPYGDFGQVYTGPGFRLPFYIISPWTRGGNVFTEHADHTSQIMFVEQWLGAKGYNVTSSQIPTWRRAHMSNLVNAFDFSAKDMSLPTIPVAKTPHTTNGQYDGGSHCLVTFPNIWPPVPYGNQTVATSLVSENGFKVVRGQLTEGRYLVLEANGYAVSVVTSVRDGSVVTGTKATATHETKEQRWVVHQVEAGGSRFTISNASNGEYIGVGLKFVSGEDSAQVFTINDLGNGQGYRLQVSVGQYLQMSSDGAISLGSEATGFKIFSVTYDK